MRFVLRVVVALSILGMCGISCPLFAASPERVITRVAASPNGAELFFYVADAGYAQRTPQADGELLGVNPGTGAVLWREMELGDVRSLAVSPDGQVLAVGYYGAGNGGDGIRLLNTATGKQTGSLPNDEDRAFRPNETFPTGSTGVAGLVFAPTGDLLYGVVNRSAFAWDVGRAKLVWQRRMQRGRQPDDDDQLSGISVSGDGRYLAVVEEGAPVVLTAGRGAPQVRVRRVTTLPADSAVLTPDGESLAAGESLSPSPTLATRVWLKGGTKPVDLAGCGRFVAWLDGGDKLACEAQDGVHVRATRYLTRDAQPPSAVSMLPLLQVGTEVWDVGYETKSWADPQQSLPVTLTSLSTGKQVTVRLPGRSR